MANHLKNKTVAPLRPRLRLDRPAQRAFGVARAEGGGEMVGASRHFQHSTSTVNFRAAAATSSGGRSVSDGAVA